MPNNYCKCEALEEIGQITRYQATRPYIIYVANQHLNFHVGINYNLIPVCPF